LGWTLHTSIGFVRRALYRLIDMVDASEAMAAFRFLTRAPQASQGNIQPARALSEYGFHEFHSKSVETRLILDLRLQPVF
jgi:hypothetical protein